MISNGSEKSVKKSFESQISRPSFFRNFLLVANALRDYQIYINKRRCSINLLLTLDFISMGNRWTINKNKLRPLSLCYKTQRMHSVYLFSRSCPMMVSNPKAYFIHHSKYHFQPVHSHVVFWLTLMKTHHHTHTYPHVLLFIQQPPLLLIPRSTVFDWCLKRCKTAGWRGPNTFKLFDLTRSQPAMYNVC